MEEKLKLGGYKRYVGIKQAVQKGYAECEIGGVADFLYPTSKLRRGRVQGGGQISPAITAENTGVCRVTDRKFEEEHFDMTKEELDKAWENTEYRIRKLSAKECLRLMDVTDEDADMILAVNSATQAYRQAGNSIIVTMLAACYSQLNIQGIKPWNDRTIEEKRALTALEVNKFSKAAQL